MDADHLPRFDLMDRECFPPTKKSPARESGGDGLVSFIFFRNSRYRSSAAI